MDDIIIADRGFCFLDVCHLWKFIFEVRVLVTLVQSVAFTDIVGHLHLITPLSKEVKVSLEGF